MGRPPALAPSRRPLQLARLSDSGPVAAGWPWAPSAVVSAAVNLLAAVVLGSEAPASLPEWVARSGGGERVACADRPPAYGGRRSAALPPPFRPTLLLAF